MWPMPLTPLKAAVHTLKVLNVSSSSRLLALAAWCFMRAAFLNARFFRRFFRASAFRRSSRFLPRFPPWFFRRVGCGTPTKPRLLRCRLSCLLTCDLRAILLSTLRVPRFPRRSPNVAAAGTSAAGNDFTLLGCITAGRCCLYGCLRSLVSWRVIYADRL